MLKPVKSFFFILFGILTGFFLFSINMMYIFSARYSIFAVRKLSLAIFPHSLFKLVALNTRVISRKYVRADGQGFGSIRMIKHAIGQYFGKLRKLKLADGQGFGNSRIFKREGKQTFGKLFLIKFNPYQNIIISRILVAAGIQVILSTLCQLQFSVISKNKKNSIL